MGRCTRAKRRSSSDADEKPPKKKSCASTSDNNVVSSHHRWEWEGDGGKWTQYTEKQNQAITEAYNDGKKNCELDAGDGVRLVVDFNKMLQKNKKTGWSRRVRFCVGDKSADFYVWQWKDDSGKWTPYSAKISQLLEAEHCKRTAGVVDVEVGRTTYKIDVAALTQVNTKTDFSREIAREKSDAVLTDVKQENDAADDGVGSTSGGGDAASVMSGRRVSKPASAKSTKSAKSQSAKSQKADDNDTKVRTVIVKGRAPVDPECTLMIGKASVFYEGNDVWDCMLNQTDVGNNNNKFYLIQLLKEDGKHSYSVWQRWGRVGYTGQSNLVSCGGELDKAKQIFCKKFSDKTKNDWADRQNFVKVPGKYDLLAMDYSGGKGDVDEVDATVKRDPSIKSSLPESKLDKRLQDLITLICDVKSMEEAVKEMKYDAKKMPLDEIFIIKPFPPSLQRF